MAMATGTRARLTTLLLASLAPLGAARGAPLTIAVIDRPSRIEVAAEAAEAEAYRRIHLAVQFREVPATRALAEAASGQVDGDLARIDGVNAQYPDLVQVRVPIASFNAVVVARDTRFQPHGWESLRPYTIGYHRGILFAERALRGMRTDAAPTNELVLRKLLSGRTDLAVLPEQDARALVADMPGLVILQPPVERVQLYHYLNKKHAALVPALEAALRAMQAQAAPAPR
jgi:polar amino acid transport system substrate-binding protein